MVRSCGAGACCAVELRELLQAHAREHLVSAVRAEASTTTTQLLASAGAWSLPPRARDESDGDTEGGVWSTAASAPRPLVRMPTCPTPLRCCRRRWVTAVPTPQR